MTYQEKEASLEKIKNEVLKCDKCALCHTRKNVVFARGSAASPLLFVGEAPGEQEDLQGAPFVGKAGQLLDEYLTFCGFEEEDYYITNILKCRPPHNRDPQEEEEDACLPYLRAQVKALSPRILVCLGRIAAKRIISPDFRITRDHGKWFEQGQMKIMATFHPSALLRDPSKKEETLNDFKAILEEFNKVSQKCDC